MGQKFGIRSDAEILDAMILHDVLQHARRTHRDGALVDENDAILLLALGQQFRQMVNGVEIVTQVRGAIPFGGCVQTQKDDIRAIDHLGDICCKEEVAIDIFGDCRGKARFVDIAFDLVTLARHVRRNARFVNIVCIDFMPVFRQHSGMR